MEGFIVLDLELFYFFTWYVIRLLLPADQIERTQNYICLGFRSNSFDSFGFRRLL